jgi:tetratricopeptide (TPR) repeat protein
MKKFLLFFSFIVFFFSLRAQYLTAFNNLQTYQMNSGQDKDALKKSAEAIEEAIKDERSATLGKTWYYRGYIYQIIWQDSLVKDNFPNALLTASESYQKAFNVGDTKFKQDKEATTNLILLSGQLQLQGALFFDGAQYAESMAHFLEVKKIKEFLTAKGIQNNIDDNNAIFNAVITAQKLKDNNTAKELLRVLVDRNYDNAIIYSVLADIYLAENNLNDATIVLDKAAAKYPDNTPIIISQLNIYIKEGKANEHLDKMLKAVSLEPNNHALHYVLGVTYQELKEQEKAEASYKEAIKLKPDYYDALNNIATIYIERANKAQNQMNEPKITDAQYKVFEAEREKQLRTSLEYLEAATKADPNGREVLNMLKEVYAKLGEYEKSKQIKAKLEGLNK